MQIKLASKFKLFLVTVFGVIRPINTGCILGFPSWLIGVS